MKNVRQWICFCLLLVLLAGCSQGATPTPTAHPATPQPAAQQPTATLMPLAATATSEAGPDQPTPTAEAAGWQDVTYCVADGQELKMDVYPPTAEAESPAPVAVFIHGGGWRFGDKREDLRRPDLQELTGRGYVVASINYRMATDYRFPAMVEDSKCAIRSLRANAATYNIDPERVAVWGNSAGGHLSALLGLIGPNSQYDVGQYLEFSSEVQVVANLYGPANLTTSAVIGEEPTGLQRMFVVDAFGTTDPSDPILAEGSPVNYVTPGDAPMLIVQGTMDTLVPPRQSLELYGLLIASGVPTEILMVENAEHELRPRGGTPTPSRPEVSARIADFFDAHLGLPAR